VLHVNRAVDVLGVIEQIWIFPYKLIVAFEVNRVNLYMVWELSHLPLL